jgi:hypothetical protein
MEEIDTANIISDTNPRGTRGKQIDWAKAAEKSREEGDNLDDDDDGRVDIHICIHGRRRRSSVVSGVYLRLGYKGQPASIRAYDGATSPAFHGWRA